jgi:hypothetical protein
LVSFYDVSKILYTASHFTELSDVWNQTNQEELAKIKLDDFVAATKEHFVHADILQFMLKKLRNIKYTSCVL